MTRTYSSWLFYALLILTISFASCSIEKRHYTKGYHVEWHNKINKHTQIISASKDHSMKTEKTTEAPIVAEQASTSEELKWTTHKSNSHHSTKNKTQIASNDEAKPKHPILHEALAPLIAGFLFSKQMAYANHAFSPVKYLDQEDALKKKKSKKKKANYGRDSLICGLYSWTSAAGLTALGATAATFLVWKIFALVAAIAAVSCGIAALRRKSKQHSRLGAVLGLILGSVYLVFVIIATIALA